MIDINSTDEEIEQYARSIIQEAIKSQDWSEPYADMSCMDDEQIQSIFLGSVLSLSPSGKYYTCWTSNQTDKDVEKDSVFYEALESEANKFDCFTSSGEGDPCDLFLSKFVQES